MRKTLSCSAVLLGLCFLGGNASAQSADEVKQAQQSLKDKGLDPGPVDGVDGPKTHEAVRQYQKQQNLLADGQLGPQTLDSLGVKHGNAGTNMHAAGTNLKTSYANGGKDFGHAGKELGSDVKHGEVVGGAKDFGKGVGHGAEAIGVGTGHAAKNAAKGVKNAVTGNRNKDTDAK